MPQPEKMKAAEFSSLGLPSTGHKRVVSKRLSEARGRIGILYYNYDRKIKKLLYLLSFFRSVLE